MNHKYSKINIGKKIHSKTRYELLQNRKRYNLSINDTYLENIDPCYRNYLKSNGKIKNFITFLKLIDEKID